MNLLIVDLECTCDDDPNYDRSRMEIIEIGAVLVDSDTLNEVGKFSTFVKPTVDSKLSAFCTKLTTIKQSDIDNEQYTLEYHLNALYEFASNHGEFIFGSWGNFDKAQINRETQRKRIGNPFKETYAVNLKDEFASVMDTKPCGVGKALSIRNLKFEGTPHRALDDTINISRILRSIYGIQ